MERSLSARSEKKSAGSFLATPQWDLLNKMPPNQSVRSSTNQFASPYEWRKAHRLCKKIYPNRINTLWYRRYINKLPEDEQIDFQPFDEVQKVDEDIALQYFYGEDGRIEDTDMVEKRRTALQRYNGLKEQEEKDRIMLEEEAKRVGFSWYTSVMKAIKDRGTSEFGATVAEKKVLTPLIDFLQKMSLKKRRQVRHVSLKPGSRWKLLCNPTVVRKLNLMYRNLRMSENQARFRRIISLVACAMRFIITIRIISGSTKIILKELDNFSKQQRADNKLRSTPHGRKKMFDPAKYTFKDIQIPFETMLTLTKPWFVRTEKEIDKVLTVLQTYKSFVQYPPIFQRRLARLAWYIEIEANKYIIRERHIATDFYVLLKGKAKEVRLVGNPYIKAKSEMRETRYIRKSQAFGDESMSDPECQRDYSIISCEPCCLLAISVYDYSVMLHTKQDNETAPEHILFISHLKLMEAFPKKKLLEEGDENITIHYFRQDSVISKNLDTCKYVFVVFNGNCRVVSEMVPEKPASQNRGRRYTRKITPTHSTTFRRSIIEREKINQNVTQRINFHLQKRGQHKVRSDSVGNKALADEVAVLHEKSQRIIKTLPREVRRTFNIDNFTKIVDKSLPTTYPEESRRATRTDPLMVHSVASSLSLHKWSSILAEKHSKVINEKVSQEIVTSETTKKLGSKYSYDPVGEKEEEEKEDEYSVKSEGSASSIQWPVQGSSRADSQTMEHPQTQPPAETQSTDLITGPKVLKDWRAFSQWKHVRHMNRGDFVGQEWLDFNRGPYDPPDEPWSLVSDGCEVIMIKKTFLLKHLRRNW